MNTEPFEDVDETGFEEVSRYQVILAGALFGIGVLILGVVLWLHS